MEYGAAIHRETVETVRQKLSDTAGLFGMAEIFKMLGDPTRLGIVNALLLEEMCVRDLACLFNLSEPAVSHHLKMLRQTRLVKFRKAGKQIYYSLDDDHIHGLFRQCRSHVEER